MQKNNFLDRYYWIWLLILTGLLHPVYLSAGDIIALVGEQIIDGIEDEALAEQVILIEGERIIAVADRSAIPAQAKIITLKGATLLPGLIDSHAHPLT